jgi:hypothetical protein
LSLSLLAASLLASAQPTIPPEDPLAPLEEPQEAEPEKAPEPAPAPLIVPKDWPEVFAAIRSGQWAAAQAGIRALPASPMSALARAELFTARGSPPVSADQLLALLAEAPELPQAEQCSAWP